MSKKTAIVTGSSQGIGEAIVRRLAAEGYAVVVNDLQVNDDKIQKLVDELNATHGDGTALGIVADVTSSAEVVSMISEAVQKLGPLRVMVANAGIARTSLALETSEEDVRTLFDVNFMGVWLCYTHAARQMISQGPVPEGSVGYRILGAASIAAFKPTPLFSHYGATKWAVRGFTQVFAMEMAKYKINVNAYAPGIVGTAIWDNIDTERFQKAEDMTALGRTSVPEDVGNPVGGFLCSKDADFITGQTLVIDGGIVFT
ncbi:hypothetical protein AYL99_11431 [Fonsecaea erecta]|uniref:Uncharacterized protein n=1 Tax=Fonsecaea erecta TaxID=1367422 RepID=A0A178Z3I5_9EURO|nr:hypothetical protein AYL99_11431 [Fonsecaea erecta]OAP54330.1 hypothetical protein AYL99_11431 [Fonsecaea erecta]